MKCFDLIRPDYLGANVRSIVPALLGPADWETGLPDWLPALVRGARQAVLLVLDGLGWEQLVERPAVAPTLSAMTGGPITTVAPSTTATALCSIATGLTPGEHGLIGYRMMLGGEVINVLRWAVDGDDRRRHQPPEEIQRYPAFLGNTVPVISPAELIGTSFSAAHQRGGHPIGWSASSSMPIEVRRQLDSGQRFVYAYYGGIDRIAHERGFGEFYDAELRAVDRLVGDVLDVLPPGAVLLVTSDHGQVDTWGNKLVPPGPLLQLVAEQSGEGRFRWLHARRGAAGELAAAAKEAFGEVAWVATRDELIDGGWFGPTVAAPVAARLGDVALVARAPVWFHDPDDTGPFELICRHGSLTPAEAYVPLLAGAGR